MKIKKISLVLSAIILTAGVIMAILFENPYAGEIELTEEVLQEYILSAGPLLNEDGKTTDLPEIEELYSSSDEILQIAVKNITTKNDDIIVDGHVTDVVRSEKGIKEGEDIYIYLPIYVNKGDSKYFTLNTFINIPKNNEIYIAFLTEYFVSASYNPSEKDKNTFLLTNEYVGLFPTKEKLNVMQVTTNEGSLNTMFNWEDIKQYDFIVKDTEEKITIETIYSALSSSISN